MEVVSLGDLAPVLAAVVGPMLAVVFAMMRYSHVDSVKTRDLMHELIEKASTENRELVRENKELIEKASTENKELIRENKELIEKASRENRELVRENKELIRENRELIEKNHLELTGGLGEVRERLSYIEGFLRRSLPPFDGDSQAA